MLEWNLANDVNYGPHTPGGCTTCKGALTINGDAVKRNVAYYIVAHISKFVPPGSVRISSSSISNLPNVAFKTPSGKIVLIVLNEIESLYGAFNINVNGKTARVSVTNGSVTTFVLE